MPEKIDLKKMDAMEKVSIDRLFDFYEESPENFESRRLAVAVTSVSPRKHAGNFLPWMIVLNDNENGTLYEGAKHTLQGYILNCKDANKTCIVDHFNRAEFKEMYNAIHKHLIKNEKVLDEESLRVAEKFVNTPDDEFKEMTMEEVLKLATVVRALGSINVALKQNKNKYKKLSDISLNDNGNGKSERKSFFSFLAFGKSKNNEKEASKD